MSSKLSREALMTIAKAFDDGRGLDSHLVQELNLNIDDLFAIVAEASFILAGYTVAPEWMQLGLVGAGAALLSDIPPSIATTMILQAQADNALKQLKRM